MTTDTILRARLVDQLTADGALTDPRWINAFATVPRHAFAPIFRYRAADDRAEWLDGTNPTQRDEWLRVAYTDTSLITQVDEGDTATSASSQPAVMARMLETLNVHDGMTVLEIGTGTGYNAALLCRRLGDDQVVTVEVDRMLADVARTTLAELGYRPTVIACDGLAGYAPRAPYDRIIATCGVPTVPWPWVEQLADGGVMVVNVGHYLARLVRQGDEVAGPFLPDQAGFMVARPSGGPAHATYREALALADTGAGVSRPVHIPYDLGDPNLRAFIHLFLPGLVRVTRINEDDSVEHCVADPETRSWALARGSGTVTEGGSRWLWGEVEQVYARWRAAGRPDPSQLGLRIGPGGVHTVELLGTVKAWPLTPQGASY